MAGTGQTKQDNVHCRIGSLEKVLLERKQTTRVHCRIGSLETQNLKSRHQALVHCRIGSLENQGPPDPLQVAPSGIQVSTLKTYQFA